MKKTSKSRHTCTVVLVRTSKEATSDGSFIVQFRPRLGWVLLALLTDYDLLVLGTKEFGTVPCLHFCSRGLQTDCWTVWSCLVILFFGFPDA